jgi:protein-disulfide isomerase/uncharacterized membrane protein
VAKTASKSNRASGDGRLLGAMSISNVAYWWVSALLSVAVAISALLAAKHFGGGLPGCGPRSGCEALEATAWGAIPWLRWPVSFVGFAYFFALLAGWIAARREIPNLIRWLMRLGGLVSLLFIGVMIIYWKICPYCVGVHSVNLATVLVMEGEARRVARRGANKGGPPSRGLISRVALATVGGFLALTVVLAFANARFERKKGDVAEGERRASTEKILAQTDSQVQTQSQSQADLQPLAETQPQTKPKSPAEPAAGIKSQGAAQSQSPSETAEPSRAPDRWGPAGFTGRYRLGPEASPIRIVMLTDYQCPDCKRVEHEIQGILASRGDVSLSIKLFPFCTEASPGVPCNPYVSKTLHANACWAARAAEAAGILKGNDGFWAMHRWLFARGGSFTDAELKAGLAELGFEQSSFLSVMMGPETLDRIREDCGEGHALGIYYTPMIFVNGVEFKGWQVEGALSRTIEEVAAKNPPPRKATADRPVLAAQRYIDDWREQPARAIPSRTPAWTLASTGTGGDRGTGRAVDVVLFGDYQEPFTAAMDLAIRDLVKGKSTVRYAFRHFPIDPACNPTLPSNVRPEAIHPKACLAAKAAEAAGSIGGADGFWKMHDWLMRNLASVTDESIRAAAANMGMNPDNLFAEMQKPETAAAILQDVRVAQQLGLTAVPMVFVNGRWVPRTMREEENVVLQIIEAAGRP